MDFNDEFNCSEPSFANLPTEIIAHIFRFLTFSDVQNASLVCRRWFESSQYIEFRRNVLYLISHQPYQIIPKENMRREFINILIKETAFDSIENDLKIFGRKAESITFDSVEMSTKEFCLALENRSDLKNLTIARCKYLFMAGQFLETIAEQEVVAKPLSSLTSLSLQHNSYLTDAILMRLTKSIEKLEKLDMAGCNISFHNAIQKRFYPGTLLNAPSEAILSLSYILYVINKHKLTLKELNLSRTLIGKTALSALCETESLQLETLLLRRCGQLNTTAIGSFLQTQNNLKHLDLSYSQCVNDELIDLLAKNTDKLEELHIKATKITNIGAISLKEFKNLKVLDISSCGGVTGEGITKGIASSLNVQLKELYMSHLDLCAESIKLCARSLPELRILDISHCVDGVIDDSIQEVIKNLKWLRILNLTDCFRITDVALTGINFEDEIDPGCSMLSMPLNLKNNFTEKDCPKAPAFHISLRSKAEDEIVRDAKRKTSLLAVSKTKLNTNQITGFSLQRLKGLQSLNLKGCIKISDVSLQCGFKSVDLKNLVLSECQQITSEGIEALVANCPALEELDFSNCFNIDDRTIKLVTSKLKRLKSLNVSGCIQLTEHSIDAILSNCKALQTFSAYRCNHMSCDIEERLANLSSLRTFNGDNAGSMENSMK